MNHDHSMQNVRLLAAALCAGALSTASGCAAAPRGSVEAVQRGILRCEAQPAATPASTKPEPRRGDPAAQPSEAVEVTPPDAARRPHGLPSGGERSLTPPMLPGLPLGTPLLSIPVIHPSSPASMLELGSLIAAIAPGMRSTLSPDAWLQTLDRILTQVGEIHVNSLSGTAFLVGPDLVLTNHHVVDALIERKVLLEDVYVHFDHPIPGSASACKEIYRLAPEGWLVANSQRSAADDRPDPKPFQATVGELDYALIRLDGEPGQKRGYIPIPVRTPAVSPGDFLLVVQHPEGELGISVEPYGFIGSNGPHTRLRYLNRTQDGASGSPIFDRDLRLVGIHRSEEPEAVETTYNEGVPLSTIVAHLPPEARAALGLDEPH